eukprot:2111604-Rhodomonas_salina.6
MTHHVCSKFGTGTCSGNASSLRRPLGRAFDADGDEALAALLLAAQRAPSVQDIASHAGLAVYLELRVVHAHLHHLHHHLEALLLPPSRRHRRLSHHHHHPSHPVQDRSLPARPDALRCLFGVVQRPPLGWTASWPMQRPPDAEPEPLHPSRQRDCQPQRLLFAQVGYQTGGLWVHPSQPQLPIV